MRALEAAAFASGTSEAELQRRAGNAVAEEAFKLVESNERVVVYVGHGNNGRDGGVAAQWLLQHDVAVDLVVAPRHGLTADELSQLRSRGASIIPIEDTGGAEHALARARLAIDAITGIGIKGALREPLASMVCQLDDARQTVHVLALDVPSGVDADSGEVPGEAVWADTTVTLGAVKQGLLRFPAAERVGRLIARDIGIPAEARATLPYAVLDEAMLAPLVPARPLDAHKYRFGRALVIAGSDHFLGAPVLCAGGAARVGAGLITVASTRDVRLNVARHLPEVTFTQSDVNPNEGLDQTQTQPLEPYLGGNTVVIGPGLGRSSTTTRFVSDVLGKRSREHGLVIDADGLFALSEIPNWPELVDANTILTPHSGELERLVGGELEAQVPIWVHASRLAKDWGCVLVAKGPFTCVAAPDGRVDVWPRANPALATGGTGDVLAGATAGLLAQRLSAWDAARLAVGVHGLAAERIIRGRGWRTLLASDLFEELPSALAALATVTQPR